MLVELFGFPFPVVATAGIEEKARDIAARTHAARSWLSQVLGFEPQIRVEVLGREDFAQRAELPELGLPHVNDDGTMFLAGYDTSTFESSIAETLKYLSAAERSTFVQAYGEPPNVQAFVDLLSVHELAHTYHMQQGRSFRELWMSELFCNLALHGYVAAHEPQVLAALVTLPSAAQRMAPEVQGVTGLDAMGPDNPLTYVWYEFRLQVAASRLWDAGGLELLRDFYESAPQDGRADATAPLPPAIDSLRDAWPHV